MFPTFSMYKFVSLALIGASTVTAHPTSPGSQLEARQTGPSIVRSVGTWQYKGCYEDFGTRILTFRYDVPGGNNAERCTTLCASNGYGLAGMEYGQECWCDNYMPFEDRTVLMPDSDCNTPCQGDTAEFCGAGNRMTLYQNSAATPPDPTQCITWRGSWWSGGLQAVNKDGTGLPITLWSFFTNPLNDATNYNILSGPCPGGSCPYGFKWWELSNNALRAFGSAAAIRPNIGDSQAFISVYGNTPAAYCLKPNPISPQRPFIGYPVLSVDGNTDKWAFCTNTSADGRQDIVYSPIANHAHYDINACTPVNIEFIQL